MAGEGVPLSFAELSRPECVERLNSARIGRVAISLNALPTVLPVHFGLNTRHDAVVIRTKRGTKLSAALRGAIVAFEVDEYHPETDGGWSVLVQGRSSEITDASEIAEAQSLSLRPASPGDGDDHFIRVELDIVTGRELVEAPA